MVWFLSFNLDMYSSPWLLKFWTERKKHQNHPHKKSHLSGSSHLHLWPESPEGAGGAAEGSQISKGKYLLDLVAGKYSDYFAVAMGMFSV